jgi:NadR type nicotinamide-nucleotide adenylyltransferase
MPIKKIVVIGPESTGKSTLCSELAARYGTDWVPEYAREYLMTHGKNYSYEDLLTIAKAQVALEDKQAAAVACRSEAISVKFGNGGAREKTPILFIDTDMYVMRVWCEFVFGKCHAWILDQIALRKYDGYLLCCTDLPWVKDELREYPDLISREKLFHIYRDSMINQSTPWAGIRGAADQRLRMAVEAVDNMTGRDAVISL